MSAIKHVIIQAGGRGSRLKSYTINKPKALLSIDNKPLIFHQLDLFPEAHFYIISDYKHEVLEKYLDVFCKQQYTLLVTGNKGTCSGINDALKFIPDDDPLVLMWCDLFVDRTISVNGVDSNEVGVTSSFKCRWSIKEGKFVEESSDSMGVCGFFKFRNKEELRDLPDEGEFVRWISQQSISFQLLDMANTKEFGLESDVPVLIAGRCRPFNSIVVNNNHLIKSGVDEQGMKLAIDEIHWYRHVSGLGFNSIPRIYGYEPLDMELIEGGNPFIYDYSDDEKKEIIQSIVEKLTMLHELESSKVDEDSVILNYYCKTFDRLDKVQSLIPLADQEYIQVNGHRCRNPFFYRNEILERVRMINCEKFALIHGDCTFSNIVLKCGRDPFFIDPRGYFGNTKLYGDTLYDWSKLYYSIVGNYDQFNLRHFSLSIADEIEVNISSNGWECTEKTFFDSIPSDVSPGDVKFIHALIWLSLTTYAWDDYDSICASFYIGTYYMEEVL